MGSSLIAVLINVTGIQDYIFSSNKLKENIGASYIIEKEVFHETMKNSLISVFNKVIDIDSWWNSKLKEDKDCRIGYIGGGNALLLFGEKARATEFIETFSKDILLNYPGLQLAIGIKEGFDENQYKKHFQELVENLKKNKSGQIPVTSIPKHGITDDCPWSNDASEEYYKETATPVYISKSSYVKVLAAKKAQENAYKEILRQEYKLTTDIEDKLGQKEEGSYIAVVHIDGNGMGSRFANINNLVELREKSNIVSSKANKAMEMLIQNLISNIEQKVVKGKVEYWIGDIKLIKEEAKIIVPIRPILVGGDDITFICEGRLGVYLAEKFIKYFYDDEESKKSDSEKLMDGACAGVAIVKTHFPFYKAVKLAEELCAEAKKPSKKTKGCYISYFYSASTFSGSLEQLRQRTHGNLVTKRIKKETGSEIITSSSMYSGPYWLPYPGFEDAKNYSIDTLKNGISKLKKWPKNKVMALREVIADSEVSQRIFEKEIAEVDLKLPGGRSEIWETIKVEKPEEKIAEEKEYFHKQTPFFDQIELMDFYLDEHLNNNGNESND